MEEGWEKLEDYTRYWVTRGTDGYAHVKGMIKGNINATAYSTWICYTTVCFQRFWQYFGEGPFLCQHDNATVHKFHVGIWFLSFWCRKPWLASTESWPQPHPTPLRCTGLSPGSQPSSANISALVDDEIPAIRFQNLVLRLLRVIGWYSGTFIPMVLEWNVQLFNYIL